MKQQQGFTLIELVVVIVILGILAAVAVPRFVSIQADARIAVLRGMEASVRGAAELVHAQALAQGVTNSVTVEGQAVALVNGYPSNASIVNAVRVSGSNVSPTAGTTGGAAATFDVTGVTTQANCRVSYAESTGANLPPTISLPAGLNCN